eukprot:Tbor_TRINITY_DN5987_c0_g2::TRINITY_DN5987_c0_g2_i3::g.18372::m.18372
MPQTNLVRPSIISAIIILCLLIPFVIVPMVMENRSRVKFANENEVSAFQSWSSRLAAEIKLLEASGNTIQGLVVSAYNAGHISVPPHDSPNITLRRQKLPRFEIVAKHAVAVYGLTAIASVPSGVFTEIYPDKNHEFLGIDLLSNDTWQGNVHEGPMWYNQIMGQVLDGSTIFKVLDYRGKGYIAASNPVYVDLSSPPDGKNLSIMSNWWGLVIARIALSDMVSKLQMVKLLREHTLTFSILYRHRDGIVRTEMGVPLLAYEYVLNTICKGDVDAAQKYGRLDLKDIDIYLYFHDTVSRSFNYPLAFYLIFVLFICAILLVFVIGKVYKWTTQEYYGILHAPKGITIITATDRAIVDVSQFVEDGELKITPQAIMFMSKRNKRMRKKRRRRLEQMDIELNSSDDEMESENEARHKRASNERKGRKRRNDKFMGSDSIGNQRTDKELMNSSNRSRRRRHRRKGNLKEIISDDFEEFEPMGHEMDVKKRFIQGFAIGVLRMNGLLGLVNLCPSAVLDIEDIFVESTHRAAAKHKVYVLSKSVPYMLMIASPFPERIVLVCSEVLEDMQELCSDSQNGGNTADSSK